MESRQACSTLTTNSLCLVYHNKETAARAFPPWLPFFLIFRFRFTVFHSRLSLYHRIIIDINYSKNITLDSLAEITHINKFYLAHSFTECIGQSPINYLADRRIEACKELLTTSDLSVTQIASSAGFSSQSYFSQIFNKKVGMSPRQYRKLYSHEKKE